MLGDMFLWRVVNLKQGVIYFIKQGLPPNISAGSVASKLLLKYYSHVVAEGKISVLVFCIL